MPIKQKNTKTATKKHFWQQPLSHFHWWQTFLFVLLTFGGVVYASFSLSGCNILDPFNQGFGIVCTKLDAEGSSKAIETFEIKEVNNDQAIGGSGYESNLIGKKLRFTNNNNEAVFVPFRTKTELNSFLTAKQKGDNTHLNKIDVCEKNVAIDVLGSFTGVLGCGDGSCTPSCYGSGFTSGCTGGTFSNAGSNYCQKVPRAISSDSSGGAGSTEVGANHCATETNASDCNSSDNQYLSHLGTYFSCSWGGAGTSGSCSSLGQSGCNAQSGYVFIFL